MRSRCNAGEKTEYSDAIGNLVSHQLDIAVKHEMFNFVEPTFDRPTYGETARRNGVRILTWQKKIRRCRPLSVR
jgi:hypothetical protein